MYMCEGSNCSGVVEATKGEDNSLTWISGKKQIIKQRNITDDTFLDQH